MGNIRARLGALIGVVLIVASGCATGRPSSETAGVPAQPSAHAKRITVAFARELDLIHWQGQGRPLLRTLVNPGLSIVDDDGARRPALAESVPSLQNGLWKTFPDGRMETSWTIRQGARWH